MRKRSNLDAAKASSLPLLMLDQPAAWTVVTSWPVSSSARSLGGDSSSRIRIVDQSCARLLQDCYCDIPAHRGELLEKDIKRVALLDVVEQVPNGNARACEHRLSALNVWVDDDQGFDHAEAPGWP